MYTYFGSGGSPSDRWFMIADMNGDGQVDAVRYEPNSGNVWMMSSQGNGKFSTPTYKYFAKGNVPSAQWFRVGDIDANGSLEYLTYATSDGNVIANILPCTMPDRIAKIILGFDAALTIQYLPISNAGIHIIDNTSSYPYLDFQSPLYVVSQTQTSNGIGGNYTTNYTYAGTKAHLTGGGFLGFRQVTANDPQTGITTTTTYSQNYPYQGLPQTVEKRTSTGQLLNQAQNLWQYTSLGGGSYHRSDLVQIIEQSWDLNGAAMPRSQTNTTYDVYGNATQIKVATDDGYSSSARLARSAMSKPRRTPTATTRPTGCSGA